MRWSISLALALSVAACRQTIVLDQHVDGGGGRRRRQRPGVLYGAAAGFHPEAPEVIVALDRSVGMATRFGDSTVLAAARDAIDQQATRYQKLIRFGYVEFPGASNSLQPAAGMLRERGEFALPLLRRLRHRTARLRSKSSALLLDHGLPTAHDCNPV